MSNRVRAISFAVALVAAFPLFAQTGAPTATLTTESIEAADRAGTLAERLSARLGQNPTPEQLAKLDAIMKALAKTRPALAARLAAAVAGIANDLAKTNPQAAASLVKSATDTISNPNVIAAAPGLVARTVISLSATITLAERAAVTQGIQLAVSAAQITATLEGLASNPLLARAEPGLAQQVADAIAAAKVADVTTAADGTTTGGPTAPPAAGLEDTGGPAGGGTAGGPSDSTSSGTQTGASPI